MPSPSTHPQAAEHHATLLFRSRNQAVRIPRELELQGTEVLISKEGDSLVLTPVRKHKLRDLLASWTRWTTSCPKLKTHRPSHGIPREGPCARSAAQRAALHAGHERAVRADPQPPWPPGREAERAGTRCLVHQHRGGVRASIRRAAQGLGAAHPACGAVAAGIDRAAYRWTRRPYADIRATLERSGTPIGSHDLFIAAHARSRGMTLLKRNLREFQRVPGLSVEGAC